MCLGVGFNGCESDELLLNRNGTKTRLKDYHLSEGMSFSFQTFGELGFSEILPETSRTWTLSLSLIYIYMYPGSPKAIK